MGLNFQELGQAELILQCYLSPSSFFKATAAPESLVYPVLFVQEHQMAEKWNNAFLNGTRIRQIRAGFKWNRPLRSLLFPLPVHICYLHIPTFQPLFWVTWLSFKQSGCFFTSGLKNSIFTVKVSGCPKEKRKSSSLFHAVPKRSHQRKGSQ